MFTVAIFLHTYISPKISHLHVAIHLMIHSSSDRHPKRVIPVVVSQYDSTRLIQGVVMPTYHGLTQ